MPKEYCSKVSNEKISQHNRFLRNNSPINFLSLIQYFRKISHIFVSLSPTFYELPVMDSLGSSTTLSLFYAF